MRVATWNISFGLPEKTDAVYVTLASLNADVITLNEADHEAVVADLAQRLGMTYVWARGSGNRHVGTLSRYPIVRWQIFNRKPLTQAALMTTLETPSGLMKVWNIHLRPDPYWHYEIFRYLAVNNLLAVIRQQPEAPHLIMGDFNTYGAGDPVDVQTILKYMRPQDAKILRAQRYRFLRISLPRLLRAGYTDCFRKLYPREAGHTFMRHGELVNRMDYVVANRDMARRLVDCRPMQPVDASVSDHLPLIADFR